MKNIVAAALLFGSLSVNAQFVGNGSFDGKRRAYLDDGAWAPREHNVDFIHMRLELNFETATGLVEGKKASLRRCQFSARK